MHTDEAVQALKFGDLLENNFYKYDKNEYHGPTLYYFTLIPAWISSAENISEISESTLRIVPVFFGIGLIILLLLLTDGLSRPIVIVTGILTAVSPAMAYYSGYYIQEMLLVFFTFAAIVFGYRYLKSGHIAWAIVTGLFLGLLHATKETSVIVTGSMLTALFLTIILRKKDSGSRFSSFRNINFKHIMAMIVSAVVVSALFYSSFFTNPAGIADSYLTFGNYLIKAAENDFHLHPWYYYLNMLVYFKVGSGPVWSEALIVLLAITGFVSIMLNKRITGADNELLRFFAFYTFIMTVLYSVIPYKTPWLMLGFLHGMIILAGVGVAALFNIVTNKRTRIIITILLFAGGIHLFQQSYLSNFRYHSDPSNPYVYAHTSSDIFQIVQRVNELAEAHPDGKNMHIEVICPGHDYWPLPWYLRAFPNTGWWDKVDLESAPAPVIIASPQVEQDILKKLYEIPPPGKKNLYMPLFDSYLELRPSVELRGYVIKELWDKFVQNR